MDVDVVQIGSLFETQDGTKLFASNKNEIRWQMKYLTDASVFCQTHKYFGTNHAFVKNYHPLKITYQQELLRILENGSILLNEIDNVVDRCYVTSPDCFRKYVPIGISSGHVHI